jgi:hypothetical protein
VGNGDYLPRLLDGRLSELFAQLPALLITGPRAAGKTTTGRRHAASIVRLDREAEAAASRRYSAQSNARLMTIRGQAGSF